MALVRTVEEFAREAGEDPRDVVNFFTDYKRAKLVALDAARQAEDTSKPAQALPLRDNAGYEFGRVAASIPEDLFFAMMQDKTFGMQQRLDAQDLREVLAMCPECRVDTVSGKTTVGWRRGGRWDGARPGVRFDKQVTFAQ